MATLSMSSILMSGSWSQVSMTTGPSRGIASSRASSQTTSPLDALMKKAPSRILAKNSRPAILRVVSFKGTCIVTISEFASRVSRSQNSNGPSASALGGSHLSTLKPSALAILSIMLPTWPTPMMPIVSPERLIARLAARPYRAEKTYSMTPPALHPGAFLTMMPFESQYG